MKFGMLLVIIFLLSALTANAQTPTLNPTRVEFTASTDHSTINTLNSQPVIASYDFNAVAPNSLGAIALTRSLGKPTPGAVAGCAEPAPCISVLIPELATITKNVAYTATITAVGPGGSSAPSAPSNSFGSVGPPAAPGKPTVR